MYHQYIVLQSEIPNSSKQKQNKTSLKDKDTEKQKDFGGDK